MNKKKEEIKSLLGDNLIGFCQKPYDKEQLNYFLSEMNSNEKKIFFKTFPSFDLFINQINVHFQRNKPKELLALLVDKRGSTVTIDQAVGCLWGDKEPVLAKKLYRDATSRLRLLLQEYNISNLVEFNRGSLRLSLDNVYCDAWDFIDNNQYNGYLGDYMQNYEWAFETRYSLSDIWEKKVKK